MTSRSQYEVGTSPGRRPWFILGISLAALWSGGCNFMVTVDYRPTGATRPLMGLGDAQPALFLPSIGVNRDLIDRRSVEVCGAGDVYQTKRPPSEIVHDALAEELGRLGGAVTGSREQAQGTLMATLTRFESCFYKGPQSADVEVDVLLHGKRTTEPVWTTTLRGHAKGPWSGLWFGPDVVSHSLTLALSEAVSQLGQQPGFAESVASLAGTRSGFTKTPVVPGQASGAETPPHLEIVVSHPKTGSRTQESSVVLVWNILSKKPLAEWNLSVNGRRIASTRDVHVQARKEETGYRLSLQRRVELDTRENTIVFQAIDDARRYAEKVLTVYRDPVAELSRMGRPAFRGQRWAVVIGVSRYQHASKGIPNLRYADRDARAFYEFLKTPQGGAFTEDHIRFLTDEQATYARVREALFDFLRQPIKEDLVIIFYAGHGVPEPGNSQNLFLLTHDSDPERLVSTAFPMWDLETTLTRFVKAERVLVLTDACHSAGVGVDLTTRSEGGQNLINRYLQELNGTGTSRAIFTASEASELSQESERWGGGHGVFTYYLLESLGGAGDTNQDGIVTLGEAMDYVSEQVRRATRNGQHPATSGRFDRSMPVAVWR